MEEFVFVTMGFTLSSAGAAFGIYSALFKFDTRYCFTLLPTFVAATVALFGFLSTVRCIYAVGKTETSAPIFASSLISGNANLISGVLIAIISNQVPTINRWWILPYLLALTISIYGFVCSLFVLKGTGIL